ncbi:D-isomer specific 2-hydroxyacid dehydrogenase [Pavlovales sp. CCMP2436]|nr:D-isomer specific 2-hydroxyacid dehydrogenase [Pavlovales sp. CCMP2436]|mmetsp:Transcript_35354/g.81881  ORF Transcript_35354/g.81881 Transcript_35354/m.81881 type:complete len:336 (+) Transcript_35354:492-1499(+)
MAPLAPRMIAVLAQRGSPALRNLPQIAGCALHVCSTSGELLALSPRPSALLWIAPAPPSELLAAWPALFESVTWVHSFSAGVDLLAPFFAASGAGAPGSRVQVSNGRGAFSESLAEYVLWAMLHHAKRAEHCVTNKATKQWDKFVMPQLRGKQVGFVGFGSIATTTAPLCRALGMRVLALRNTDEPHPLADETLSMCGPDTTESKRRVFEESDYVVCTLPGTPGTFHFCGGAEFGAMKKDAVFISLGRGSAVDEAALAAALLSGQIAGAACDVFEVEPVPPSSPLWTSPNLLMTAHNADYEERYFDLGWGVAQGNAEKWLAGRPLDTPVLPARGY